MKKISITVASVLLLTGAGVGYASYSPNTYEKLHSDRTVVVNENISDDIVSYDEYEALSEILYMNQYGYEVLQDNQQKRVLLLLDKNNQAQIKTIFVKDTKKLKVIDFARGIIFDQNIDYFNEANKQNEISSLVEFEILKTELDLNQLQAEIVIDREGRRVIVFSDKDGKQVYKSIYVKHTNGLKIVDFKNGILFNQTIKENNQDQVNTQQVKEKQESASTPAPKQEETAKSEEKIEAESGISSYVEYKTVATYINMSGLTTQVAEDNHGKRIILFKDGSGQMKYKSIYIKNNNRLKIIQMDGGLVYNASI